MFNMSQMNLNNIIIWMHKLSFVSQKSYITPFSLWTYIFIPQAPKEFDLNAIYCYAQKCFIDRPVIFSTIKYVYKLNF